MIIRSRNIKSIILYLMNLLILGYCARQNNFSGLNCTITTSEEKPKGVRTNVTVKTIAINKCAADYPKEHVIRKCENLINSAAPFDAELFSPVTNKDTKMTFWNKYCAMCNKDVDLGYLEWYSWFPYRRDDNPCENYELEIRESDIDLIQYFTKIFIRKGMRLVTTLIGRQELECKIKDKWPIHLLNRAIRCLVTNFRDGQASRLEQCQYAEKNGRICIKMRIFIEGLKFEFSNGSKVMLEKWTEFRFDRGEYFVKSGYDNILYLCERPGIIYTGGHLAKILITAISVIFIFGFLVIKFDGKFFQDFANKVIYTYSIGLIVMYGLLTFIYLSFPVSCVVFYLAQFSWFFHLFWTKIITAEFFHLIYYACKERELDKKSQNKRYRVISVIGFVLPMILLLMYYLTLETNHNNCPLIPDHFSVTCSPVKDSIGESFMKILNLIMLKNFLIFMPILFLLAHVCAAIYFTKLGPEGIKSKSNRHHVIVLMKMAYFMAFHWILHRICVWYGRDEVFSVIGLNLNMETISQLAVDSHGILVFFVFGIDKNMINRFWGKCRCKNTTGSKRRDGAKKKVKFDISCDAVEGISTEGAKS